MSAPYMNLYVADYLGDTRHLTTEQHGAYLLLLMTMWRSDGVLSDDPSKLARITGLTVARWKRIADDVLAFFTPCEGGITQGRLAAELTIADERSEKNSQAGRMGGRAKALKDKKAQLANAMQTPCPPEPEPKREEAIASLSVSARTKPDDFEAFWQAYPAKIGKKAAASAWAKATDRPPLDDVLAAIDRYRRAKPPDRDWCHPSTWLNQGRWADEAPAPTTLAGRARNDRPDRSAKLDHLAAVFGAMGLADEPEPDHRGNPRDAFVESRVRELPSAA